MKSLRDPPPEYSLKVHKYGSKPTKSEQSVLRWQVMAEAGKLITLLSNNAEGTLQDPDGQPVEMSMSRVKSCEILLKKALPDLIASEIEVVDGGKSPSPAALEAKIAALVASRPDLLAAAVTQATAAAKPDPAVLEGESSTVGD